MCKLEPANFWAVLLTGKQCNYLYYTAMQVHGLCISPTMTTLEYVA